MSTKTSGDTWPCEAYGRDGIAINALCFFAAPGNRVCTDPADCAQHLAGERRRIFDTIHTKAAEEGPDGGPFTHLAGEFTHPDQLLGGPGSETS